MGLSGAHIWQWSSDPSSTKRIVARLARDVSDGTLAKWRELRDGAALASERDARRKY